MYGLKPDEYELILSKLFNQPVSVKNSHVYNENGKLIYYEDSDGEWEKWEYDINGKLIYYESSNGYWYKEEFDSNGNRIYFEDSNGRIEDNR